VRFEFEIYNPHHLPTRGTLNARLGWQSGIGSVVEFATVLKRVNYSKHTVGMVFFAVFFIASAAQIDRGFADFIVQTFKVLVAALPGGPYLSNKLLSNCHKPFS
jgi:hypothetical protein